MKAYDSIQRPILWKILKKIGLPQSLLECSKQFMIRLSAVSISMAKIQNHFKSWLDYYKVTQTLQYYSISLRKSLARVVIIQYSFCSHPPDN